MLGRKALVAKFNTFRCMFDWRADLEMAVGKSAS